MSKEEAERSYDYVKFGHNSKTLAFLSNLDERTIGAIIFAVVSNIMLLQYLKSRKK